MNRRASRSTLLWSALGLGMLVLACGADRRPVARFEVAPTRIELGWPTFSEIEIALEPLIDLPEDVTAPKLFIHLLDETGAVVRTFDHQVPEAWRPGREIRYLHRLHQSALAEPLTPGDYLVTLGLYDSEAGRFPLTGRAEQRGRFEYQVATAHVPPLGDNAPQARFSADWLPAEVGGDQQVVVRRTLRGGVAGRVQFGPLSGPGIITFDLFVPVQIGTGSRLELLDSAGQPRLRLVSSCGAEQLELTGTGRFEVDFRIPDAFGPAVCEVSVEPNFRLTSSDHAEAISVRLESVAWRATATGSGATASN